MTEYNFKEMLGNVDFDWLFNLSVAVEEEIERRCEAAL